LNDLFCFFQLDKILVSLETGQCHKHFNSHTIELEAVVVITRWDFSQSLTCQQLVVN